MYALLFDPNDMLMQAQRIYAAYLDPTSEGRIVVKQSELQHVEGILRACAPGEKGASNPTAAGVTPPMSPFIINARQTASA